MVRERGFEPLRPKTPEPKSGASANSATRARADFDYRKFLWKTQAVLSEPAHFSKGKVDFSLPELARTKSRPLPGAWRLLRRLDVEGVAELVEHCAEVSVTFCGVGFEAFEDGFFDGGGDFRVQLSWGNEVESTVDLFFEDFGGSGAVKGFLSGQGFVKGNAVGEDVGAVVNGFSLELFGGHVGWGAGVFGEFEGAVAAGLGEVEVDEADVPVGGDEDVFGFEVEVKVAAVVNVFEGFSYVDEDVANVAAEFFGGVGDVFFEVGALDVFHSHKRGVADFSVFDVADNVVVLLHCLQDFASGEESFSGGVVVSHLGQEFADGDGLSVLDGLPEFGHASGIDSFDEEVGAEATGLKFVCVFVFFGENT